MMQKLAVFTNNTSFLKWTDRFDTTIYSMPKESSFRVRSLISKGWWFLNLPRRIRSISKSADIMFVDFLSELGQKVTYHSKKPVYMRIHRTELDFPKLFEGVNWSNVAAVIGVSNHYAGLLRRMIPKEVPIKVIPPGVDDKKWPFKPSDSGKICAWALPTPRKRIYSLMLALKDYPIYIGGYSASDRIIVEANERFSLGHHLEPEVRFPEWQWDKEYYIHHALDESFGVAIAEAMLSGMIPFVHRIPCILEFTPEELTYVHDSELIELIEDFRSRPADDKLELKKKLRDSIVEGFTHDKVSEKMEKLFRDEL